MLKTRNSVEKGKVRYIIFQEDRSWYGVAIEFNLVVEGDDQATTYLNLSEAIRGYIEATRKAHLRPTVLNQAPSNDYARLWKDLQLGRTPKLKKFEEETSNEKPVRVVSYGFLPQFA